MSKMLDFKHPDYLHEFSVSAESLKTLLYNRTINYRSPVYALEYIGNILDIPNSYNNNPNIIEQLVGLGYMRFGGVVFDRLFCDISSLKNYSIAGMYKLHSFRAYKSDDCITSTKFIFNVLNRQGDIVPNVYISINHYLEGRRIYSNLTFDTITPRGKIKSKTILKKYGWSRDYINAIVRSYSTRRDIKMHLKELFPTEYDNEMFENIV